MKVINLRHVNPGVTFVRVDRGTDWGNPFIPLNHSEAERQRVCDLYEAYAEWRLTVEPSWLEKLIGKNIACWCEPKRCHAHTLFRLANDPERTATPWRYALDDMVSCTHQPPRDGGPCGCGGNRKERS
jgi:hypothetical protein